MLEATSEEFNQKVCQQFNTNPEQIRQDVKVLREWISQQPHLPQISSDSLLTNFLIACKNSMERAKRKIDNYYTVRLVLPDFFTDRSLEEERSRPCIEEIKWFVIPRFTPDGCALVMMTLTQGDADKFDLPLLSKRALSYGDILWNNNPFCAGYYLAIDFKLATLSHLKWMTPTLARDIMHCLQDVVPVIVKGIVIFNMPPFIELGIKVIKPFMKKKLFEKFHLHSEGSEVLEKYFPKEMLPSDYGGEEETSDKLNETWLQLLRENKSWLTNEGVQTVDESKRIGGPSTMNNGLELQGQQGSFKALCVD